MKKIKAISYFILSLLLVPAFFYWIFIMAQQNIPINTWGLVLPTIVVVFIMPLSAWSGLKKAFAVSQSSSRIEA